jgi:hypothetical protein
VRPSRALILILVPVPLASDGSPAAASVS